LYSSTRKIRIQLQDNDGDKYNLSLEGTLSKEKMLKVFTLIESLDNNISHTTSQHQKYSTNLDSLGSRLWNIIENEIKDIDFTSGDILKAYNEIYREASQLSIVSTYLARFFSKNKLARRKHGKEWIYSISNLQANSGGIGSYKDLSQFNNGLIHHYEKPSTVYDLHQ
jgi:predicted transcriptional regulator